MSERTQEPDAGPRGADASAQPILAAAEALGPVVPATAAPVPEPVRSDPPADAPRVVTTLDAPSPDVAAPAAEAALPGTHRGGFTRPPTAPIDVTEQQPEFVPTTGVVVTAAEAARPANLGGIGLGFSIVGLIASLVVGITLPLGLAGIVLGVLSLRRRVESRAIAIWTISLGVVAVVYSAGWLLWAAYRAGWLG